MKLYLSNGISVTVGSKGEVSHHPITSHIKTDGTVTILRYPSGESLIPPTHYSLIFKADGTTPIGTDFATAQAYLIANTVFKTATGGSVADYIVDEFIEKNGAIEGEDLMRDYVKENLDIIKEASLVVLPYGGRAGVLPAVKPTDGSGDLTWSRLSTTTRVNPDSFVEDLPYNLLKDSGTFSSWSLEGGSISGGFESPDGGFGACKYLKGGGGLFSGTTPSSGTKNLQIWVKPITNSPSSILISDGVTGLDNVTLVIQTGWQCIEVQYPSGTSESIYITSITDPLGIYVYQPQLVFGSVAKPYLKTTDRLNLPVIDWSTGKPAIRLEPQATNSIYNNNDFSSWLISNINRTNNYSSSMQEGILSTRLIYDGVSSNAYIHKRFTPAGGASGKTLTVSIWVKGTGTFRLKSTHEGILDNYSPDIVATLDWVRYKFTVTNGIGVAGDSQYIGIVRSLGQLPFDIEICLAQGEEGSFSTSEILTYSSAGTRLADSASMTGISHLFGSDKGSFIVDIEKSSQVTGLGQPDWVMLSDGTKKMGLYDYAIIQTITGGFNILSDFSTTKYNRNKIAYRWNAGFISIFLNGVKVAEVAKSETFNPSEFSLNVTTIRSSQEYNSLWAFDYDLTDAKLIELTTI